MGLGFLKSGYLVICGACAILLATALSVAVRNPATGYEMSIYSSTPLVVWVTVLVAIVLGVSLLVYEILRSVGKRWVFAFGILLASASVVLLVSVLRSYYAVGSDTLVHIGYVKDMANGIVTASLDAYLLPHAISTLMVLLGMSAETATNVLCLVFYTIYVVSFYFLAKSLWHSRSRAILSVTLASALLLPNGVGVRGTFMAALVFPITLLLLVRMWRQFRILNVLLFLVSLVVVWLVHPLASEASLVALLIACFIKSPNRKKLCIFTGSLVVVAGLMYGVVYGFGVYGIVFRDLANGFVSKMSVSRLYDLMLSTRRIGDLDVLPLVARRYAGILILGILAIISIVFTLKSRKRSGEDMQPFFGWMFVVLNILWVTGWYADMPRLNVVMSRMMYWVPPVAIILAVPLLDRLLHSPKMRKLAVATVAIVLVFISGYSVFTVYPSPFIGLDNEQTTLQQINGIKWLYDTKGFAIYVSCLNAKIPSRYVAAIYGIRSHIATIFGMNWQSARYQDIVLMELPPSIDYKKGKVVSEILPTGAYLVVSKSDKVLPLWEENKLHLIESDPSAKLIYKDGDELEIWLVQGGGL